MHAPIFASAALAWTLKVVRQTHLICLAGAIVAGAAASETSTKGARTITVAVEAEEEVYTYESANNGAGPMWCGGSTSLVRLGDRVFASGLETLKELKPLNNCRWLLFQRDRQGWQQVLADPAGRTREPSPLACFRDGRFFLSANPTLATKAEPGGGPARPEILEFLASQPAKPNARLEPKWQGQPEFTEHSYRSFAADGRKGELILFQNIGYGHAEWAFRDRQGRWPAQGRLVWPWGGEYDKPQPIRVCYPNVALHNRAVHFCGVSDIIEPYAVWRKFKQDLTGREWDYDFRRLFYTWTPDITRQPFAEWIEVASRDKTCGWISPCDLHVARDGGVHLLWTERAIDERLRERFFPDVKQSHSLNYAIIHDGRVVLRRTLILAEEGGAQIVPGPARFHPLPDGRLLVFCYVQGADPSGKRVAENRLMEVHSDGSIGAPVSVRLQKPFVNFFTATPRAGSAPSAYLDLLGVREGVPQAIAYARVKVK